MKTFKYRLTLDVEFDPQGVSREELTRNLKQVVRDAVNNGTLTNTTEATVERYSYTVEEVNSCIKCGSPIKNARCTDETCPMSFTARGKNVPSPAQALEESLTRIIKRTDALLDR